MKLIMIQEPLACWYARRGHHGSSIEKTTPIYQEEGGKVKQTPSDRRIHGFEPNKLSYAKCRKYLS